MTYGMDRAALMDLEGLRGLGDEETESSAWESAGKFLGTLVKTAGDAVKVYSDARNAANRDGSDVAIMSLQKTVDQTTAALERSADAVTAAAKAAAAAASSPAPAPAPIATSSSAGRWALLAVGAAAAAGGWWWWKRRKRRRR
ncbi:MAG: hypothetical protein ACF8XB_18755 [Planctomycetota bacterium JB042]